MLIKSLLVEASAVLKTVQIPSPMSEARVILCHVLSSSLEQLLMCDQEEITDGIAREYFDLIEKRATGYPIAYITGKKEFYGRDFIVTPSVLVPRPETEHMVDLFQKYFNDYNESYKILDLCAGSGCIGLSILSLYKNTYVDLADISPEALEVAKKNAKELQLIANFIQTNMLENIKNIYDCITCNPPYIAESEKYLLDKTLDFEPSIALFAPENGLYFYYILSRGLKNIMHDGSVAIIEAGFKQEKDILSIFSDAEYKILEIGQDLAGNFRNIVVGRPTQL